MAASRNARLQNLKTFSQCASQCLCVKISRNQREVHTSSKRKTADSLANCAGITNAGLISMKAKSLVVFLALVGLFAAIVAGSAFAQTWRQANVPTNNLWTGIASSADGTKLFAVAANDNAVYISTNSGAGWISNNVPNNTGAWSAVASSADGTKLAAAQNYGAIYTSTNSGVTWQQSGAPDSEWHSITSSADGSKLAAVDYWINTSTNFGATWTQLNAVGGGWWESVASSADGTRLVAATYQRPIYVSTNSGVTWTNTSSPSANWYGIVSSADGNKLAASSDSLIYTSTNAGITWILRTNLLITGRTGQSIASSIDGTRLAAAILGQLYTSTDSGVSWQRDTTAPYMINGSYSIASSADGHILLLAELGGLVYVRSNPPPILPTVSISLTNFLNQQTGYTNYVTLSWPSWATNVVVQQNSNLTTASWTTVTNLPTLITNTITQTTNYQVVVPLSGSQGFYRLNSP